MAVLVLLVALVGGCGADDDEVTDERIREEVRTVVTEIREESPPVAGEDELDAASIEQDAREGFEAAGVTIDDVSCPDSGVPGTIIECLVTLPDGREVQLPYKVNEETVDATDETVQVITDIAEEQE